MQHVLHDQNISLKTIKFIADHKSNFRNGLDSKMKYYWRTDFIVGQTNSLHNQPLVQMCINIKKPRVSHSQFIYCQQQHAES